MIRRLATSFLPDSCSVWGTTATATSSGVGSVVGWDDSWLDLLNLLWGNLWWVDLDEVWHDLSLLASLALERLHNLDLEAEHTLSHVYVTHGHIHELLLWLTSGDKITRTVLLGLCSLTTHLTTDDDRATDGTTTHDITHDVVDGHTHWRSVKELEFEDFALELRSKARSYSSGFTTTSTLLSSSLK